MCQTVSATISGQTAAPPIPVPSSCPAKALPPFLRMQIGVQALARTVAISDLAVEHGVSRKFVSRQADTAQTALGAAFAPAPDDDEKVLFQLPVTKSWLRQMVLGLILVCHSSCRGAVEFARDLLDFDISVGTVHNIVHSAVAAARSFNLGQDLAGVDFAALDEIFQNGKPVLAGAHVGSTYCFLLGREEHRDADTWGVRLLELQPRGFAPEATVADFGTGLRAGQKLALPGVPCRGDLFHVLADLTAVTVFLDNRAYDALAAHHKLRGQQNKAERRESRGKTNRTTGPSPPPPDEQLARAAEAEATAVTLADEVGLLAKWLHHDVFAVSGLAVGPRRELYDFIVGELRVREPLCPHRLAPLRTLLERHGDDLLAFAVQLERDLGEIAAKFGVPAFLARAMLDLESSDKRRPERWRREAELRRKLGHLFYGLGEAARELKGRVVRASSVIENLNSRLRPYFFLRKQLGPDYLALLQFFLNHRRFMRSEHEERIDKSPAELLTGVRHPHWLEMLGHQRFSRN